MPRPTVTRARAVFSSQGPVLHMASIEIATGGWLGVVFVAGFKVRGDNEVEKVASRKQN